MSPSDDHNGYPRGRAGGKTDAYQNWVTNQFRQLIEIILSKNPGGLTITEITKEAVQSRKGYPSLRQQAEKLQVRFMPTKIVTELSGPPHWKLPVGTGITRKTIRKHLTSMMKLGKVVKFSDRYVLVRPPLPLRASTKLNESVTQAVHGNLMHQRNYPMAPDLAGYYLVRDTDFPKSGFGDFFASHSRKFEKDMFWLDRILVYGVAHGYFPDDLYSHSANQLDFQLLKKGWKHCFQDSKLLLFVFAISPSEFLNFLTTPVGRAMAARYLNERWDEILTEAKAKMGLLKELENSHHEKA